MDKAKIREHVHYAQASYAPVCGIFETIKQRKDEPDTPEYPLSCVKKTTDFLKVTCPACRKWIMAIVCSWE
jgi:hypothetical protein